MILIPFAIFLSVVVFLTGTLISLSWNRERPVSNCQVVQRRYSYRSEPHADQTTAFPNRLRDNEITEG